MTLGKIINNLNIMTEKKYLDNGGLATLVNNIKSKVEAIIEQLNNKKQDKLISGTNIKTINGNSLLDSGDVELLANIQAMDTSETIDDVETNTYVKYVAQTLTEEQKEQVRKNIGVSENSGGVSKDYVDTAISSAITNTLNIAV